MIPAQLPHLLYLDKSTPEEFINAELMDWIYLVGDISTQYELDFIRQFGHALKASHTTPQAAPAGYIITEKMISRLKDIIYEKDAVGFIAWENEIRSRPHTPAPEQIEHEHGCLAIYSKHGDNWCNLRARHQANNCKLLISLGKCPMEKHDTAIARTATLAVLKDFDLWFWMKHVCGQSPIILEVRQELYRRMESLRRGDAP